MGGIYGVLIAVGITLSPWAGCKRIASTLPQGRDEPRRLAQKLASETPINTGTQGTPQDMYTICT